MCGCMREPWINFVFYLIVVVVGRYLCAPLLTTLFVVVCYCREFGPSSSLRRYHHIIIIFPIGQIFFIKHKNMYYLYFYKTLLLSI